MEGYKATIIKASKELSAIEKIKMKDIFYPCYQERTVLFDLQSVTLIRLYLFFLLKNQI